MNVGDIMTSEVVTVGPDTSLVEAIDLMTEKRISGLPVVDEIGAPIGVLTEGDLLRRVELGTDIDHEGLLEPAGNPTDYVRSRGRRVRDVMTRAPVTVPDTASLAQAVAIMREHGIKRLFVATDGIMTGIVTRADLTRVLGRLLRHEADAHWVDRALEAKIAADLAAQDWCDGQISVAVHDGVAEVKGTIPDPAKRDAIRVLCENTPGITAVQLQCGATATAA